NRADTPEVAGTIGTTKCVSERLDVYPGKVLLWVHHLYRWRKYQIGCRLLQLFAVCLEGARITVEVFVGAKLCWINKNTYNHLVGLLAGTTYQCKVASM